MVKYAAGESLTVELWDGSVFPGLFMLMDDGIMLERTAEHVDNTFVPWHSVKLINHTAAKT
jgi:hypothetical protein